MVSEELSSCWMEGIYSAPWRDWRSYRDFTCSWRMVVASLSCKTLILLVNMCIPCAVFLPHGKTFSRYMQICWLQVAMSWLNIIFSFSLDVSKHDYVCNIHLSKLSPFWFTCAWSSEHSPANWPGLHKLPPQSQIKKCWLLLLRSCFSCLFP